MTNDKLKQALVAFLAFLMIGASGVALAGCNNTDNKDNEDTSQHGDNGDVIDPNIEDKVIYELPQTNNYEEKYKYCPDCGKEMLGETAYHMFIDAKDEEKRVIPSTLDLQVLTDEEKKLLQDLGYSGEFIYVGEYSPKDDDWAFFYMYPFYDYDNPEKNKNISYGGFGWDDFHRQSCKESSELYTTYLRFPGIIDLKEFGNEILMEQAIYGLSSTFEYEFPEELKNTAENVDNKISSSNKEMNIPYVPGSFRKQNYNNEYSKHLTKRK